ARGFRRSYERSSGWLLLRVPVPVVALLVLLLHRRPRDLVRGFLARGVAAAVVGVPVLVPGAVEGFLVDFLGVPGDVVAHRVGQFADAVVGHGASEGPCFTGAWRVRGRGLSGGRAGVRARAASAPPSSRR